MAREKLLELLARLIDGTDRKEIRWTESDEQNVFRVTFRDGAVAVRMFSDEDGDQWYGVELLNSEGKSVEDVVAYRGSEAETLQELYTRARISALAVDEIIEGIVNEIGKRRSQT